MACLLTGIESTAKQAELDKLYHYFHVLFSFSIKAPEMGEFPLIDKEDVSPPRAGPGLTLVGLTAAKALSCGSSAKVVLLDAIPSSSTFVPPQVLYKVVTTSNVMATLQGVGLYLKRTTTMELRKAPRVGVHDALGRVTVGAIAGSRPATSTAA